MTGAAYPEREAFAICELRFAIFPEALREELPLCSAFPPQGVGGDELGPGGRGRLIGRCRRGAAGFAGAAGVLSLAAEGLDALVRDEARAAEDCDQDQKILGPKGHLFLVSCPWSVVVRQRTTDH